MSILVDSNTRLLVQGITGREGNFHTKQMIDYGTNVVGGITPGKGGEWVFGTVPVFDTVQEGVHSAESVAALARRHSVDMPIALAVDQVLNHGAGLDETIARQLSHPGEPERLPAAPG